MVPKAMNNVQNMAKEETCRPKKCSPTHKYYSRDVRHSSQQSNARVSGLYMVILLVWSNPDWQHDAIHSQQSFITYHQICKCYHVTISSKVIKYKWIVDIFNETVEEAIKTRTSHIYYGLICVSHAVIVVQCTIYCKLFKVEKFHRFCRLSASCKLTVECALGS